MSGRRGRGANRKRKYRGNAIEREILIKHTLCILISLSIYVYAQTVI